MSSRAIEALRRLVQEHPTDFNIRLDLAELLISDKLTEEAFEVMKDALSMKPESVEALRLYARVSYERNLLEDAREKLETAARKGPPDPKSDILLARVYLGLGDKHKAQAFYQLAVNRDPDMEDRALSASIGLTESANPIRVKPASESGALDYESYPTGITFRDVGGMEEVKEQLRMNIIHPLKNPGLFREYGKRIGGGILMYGPPGCGKTYISRALAGEIEATFYNVGIHEILDSFLGRSEKNMHNLFETARRNAPSVIFLDEIDALGQKRGGGDWGRAHRGTVDTLLIEMDGVGKPDKPILVIGATNTPWSVDPALRRPGRFDRVVFVPPPDQQAREEILKLHLRGKPTAEIDHPRIASKIENFSGADIELMVDRAVEETLKRAMRSGKTEPITTSSLLDAAKKMRASTIEWLSTATDYIRYSNEGGFYDQVKEYLDRKK